MKRDGGDGSPSRTEAPARGEGPATVSCIVSRDGERLEIPRFTLRVVAGPDAGKTFSSARGRAVIGSHASADLVLTDPKVSRFHCEIAVEGGALLLRDLGSRNGTSLGGVAVLAGKLLGECTLTLGSTRVKFEPSPEREAVPLSSRTRFGVMVGRSAAMRETFAMLERTAASDSTVLLIGETGTGKEAAAESIHRESPRAKAPLLVVDCGAVPAELLESELFGHEKGSFTHAVSARKGVFEEADGGTVLLDEIGELPIELQPKLLRVLERKEVRRVGSNRHARVDVRIIAATNRNLREEVNAKRFRSDLYYRLAVLEVRLPPLRERREDLPLLAEHILATLGVKGGPEAAPFWSESFLASLSEHRWDGNVRELRNYLERCVALREQAPLGEGALGGGVEPEVDLSRPLKEVREAWVQAVESRYLVAQLRKHGDNVTEAARASGLDRTQFYRLLWRNGLR